MNIIVKNTGGDNSSFNVKLKVLIIHLLILRELFFWNQDTIENFGVFHISIPYGSHAKMRIDCVVMFLTLYGMEQDLHTNISKYGVWESKSSMDVLQERSLMIDHIGVILWDMQLLQELFYTGNLINHVLFTGPIMLGLMNILARSWRSYSCFGPPQPDSMRTWYYTHSI